MQSNDFHSQKNIRRLIKELKQQQLTRRSIKKISTLERANWTIEISWVQVLVGINGNELADLTTNVMAHNSDTDGFKQTFAKYAVQENRRRSFRKMAERMGRFYEVSNNKTVIPKRDRQAKITNRHKTKHHRIGNRIRENRGLS